FLLLFIEKIWDFRVKRSLPVPPIIGNYGGFLKHKGRAADSADERRVLVAPVSSYEPMTDLFLALVFSKVDWL
ncbi:hypothetical protein SOVF_155380, partial [Spinacia oleracea]